MSRRRTGARRRPPQPGGPPRGARQSGARSADPGGPADEHLQPRDRGPVRAFVRDAVDSRRRPVLALFAPAVGVVLISFFGPASELQRILLAAGLAMLVVVALDAIPFGRSVVAQTRARFPDAQVSGLATGWYAFMRASRPRSTRRPAPRVRPPG